MNKRTAVIAGASGLIGRRIAEHLLTEGGWHVIGLARRPPDSPNIEWIAVDLANAHDCKQKLASLKNTTHVFYAARYDHPEGIPESVEINTAMLVNLVNALEPVSKLQHIHAVHGSKYYGHQLGPVPAPLYETLPRAKNRNFYFDQEDFLIEHSRAGGWTYSTSRPHSFCDPATDQPRSIGLVIAGFALIQRELGRDFDFPGSETGFNVRTQFSEIPLLARAVTWMATEPRCANQSFNVVNGDWPRWSDLWPQFAEHFGMPCGKPLNIKLADYVKDKEPVWNALVKKHHLHAPALNQFALWAYGDYQFRPEWDVVSSMDKARALGFAETLDSGEMFRSHFDHYRTQRIIP